MLCTQLRTKTTTNDEGLKYSTHTPTRFFFSEITKCYVIPTSLRRSCVKLRSHVMRLKYFFGAVQ